MQALAPIAAMTLGVTTGFVLRDEFTMPTYIRIKIAMMEYYFLTRQQVDPRIIDVIDPDHSRQIMGREVEKKGIL